MRKCKPCFTFPAWNILLPKYQVLFHTQFKVADEVFALICLFSNRSRLQRHCLTARRCPMILACKSWTKEECEWECASSHLEGSVMFLVTHPAFSYHGPSPYWRPYHSIWLVVSYMQSVSLLLRQYNTHLDNGSVMQHALKHSDSMHLNSAKTTILMQI